MVITQKKDKTKSYPKLYIILTVFAPYLEIYHWLCNTVH